MSTMITIRSAIQASRSHIIQQHLKWAYRLNKPAKTSFTFFYEGRSLQKYFFSSSKNKNLDSSSSSSSDAWIPPSHSPMNTNTNENKTRHVNETIDEAENGQKSTFVDLEALDLDELLAAQGEDESSDHELKELIGMIEDADPDEIAKYLEEMSELEDDDENALETDIDYEFYEDGINDDEEFTFDADDETEESLETKLKAIEERMQEKGNNDSSTSTAWIDDFMEASSPTTSTTSPSTNTPQWLKTRQRASLQQHPSATIEVKRNTLLTSTEIINCLNALGAVDIKLIQTKYTRENLQIDGMIIATGHNTSHLRTLSGAIVKALKQRKLAKRGVPGAKYGAEDGDDWIAIDAQNYIIHVMDELARKSTNLEGLWDDKNVDEIRSIDLLDEDKVEDYVGKNPIPGEYNTLLNDSHQIFFIIFKLHSVT